MFDLDQFFYIDRLSLVIMSLVGFIALCVATFSSRYLQGDRKQKHFYIFLIAMVASVFCMVSADHILLMLVSWGASNFFLTQLMLHKNEWKAAKQSSLIALRNFALGYVFLSLSFLLLYVATGETSIQKINLISIDNRYLIPSIIFMLLAAMTQSALWPFYRWLTSSLNSPTPVSAIMHAGLVNAGGFLLARFAPLLVQQPELLTLIFIVGIVTALLGTLWKLIQHDVKRMLACSTVGQMGFMIAQCGLGLFPAAIAHLCWHGLFKAHLFLASSAAAQEKRLGIDPPPSLTQFSLALICGLSGAYLFSLTSNKDWFSTDTTLFLIVLSCLAGTQFALSILCTNGRPKLFIAMLATPSMGALYGLNVYLIEMFLEPLNLLHPQQLNAPHFIGLGALLLAWLVLLLSRTPEQKNFPDWMLKSYVFMLNASQPHPDTVTTHRNDYQY